jgi:hypothetical protein
MGWLGDAFKKYTPVGIIADAVRCGDVCNCKKRCGGWFPDGSTEQSGCKSMCSSFPGMWSAQEYNSKTAMETIVKPQIQAQQLEAETEIASSKKVQRNFFIGVGVMLLILLIIFIVKKRMTT